MLKQGSVIKFLMVDKFTQEYMMYTEKHQQNSNKWAKYGFATTSLIRQDSL